MLKWTAANGTTYSDEQIEQWAKAQESEAEYSGKHLTAAMPGRPVSVGKNAQPFYDPPRRGTSNQDYYYS